MTNLAASCSCSSSSSSNGSSSSRVFPTLFASSTPSGSFQSRTTGFTNFFQAIPHPDNTTDVAPSSSLEPISLCLEVNRGSSIFRKAGQERRLYPPAPQPALSATALLQKAAQMGSSASNASLLRGFGIVSSSSPNVTQHQIKSDGAPSVRGLGLGVAGNGGSGLNELMLGSPSVFWPKHTTLDLLGLGMAASGGSTGGLSALLTPVDRSAGAPPFDGRDFL